MCHLVGVCVGARLPGFALNITRHDAAIGNHYATAHVEVIIVFSSAMIVYNVVGNEMLFLSLGGGGCSYIIPEMVGGGRWSIVGYTNLHRYCIMPLSLVT